jgi:hypothetical protein
MLVNCHTLWTLRNGDPTGLQLPLLPHGQVAGTMPDKVLSRTTAENPYPESERASYLKELWELSKNRIRHALSQQRTVVMSAMKQSYLGKYTIVGGVNV